MEVVPVSSLWPKNSTLRALASLLTADDPQVNKAAADYLSSGASRSHFRARVSGATQKAQVFSYHLHHFSLFWQVLHVMFVCVFTFQAVECYTQALSEAGVQSQRAACSALSCLQVSGPIASSIALTLV